MSCKSISMAGNLRPQIPIPQNRKGKSVVQFNNKNWYYTNVQDLARQLGVPIVIAKKLLQDTENNNTDRIVVNNSSEIDKISIITPDRQLLKMHFGIQRVSNKDLIDGAYRKNVNTVLADKWIGQINPQFVIVNAYINFYSDPTLLFDVLNTNGKKEYIKEAKKLGLKYNKELGFHSQDPAINWKSHELLWQVNNSMDNNFKLNNINWDKLGELSEKPSSPIQIRNLEHYVDNSPLTFVHDIDKSISSRIVDKYNKSALFYETELKGKYSGKEIEYKDGYIAENVPKTFQLEEWANIEYDWTDSTNDSCAVKFLSSRYPKHYWKFKKLEKHDDMGFNKGILLDDFMKMCHKYLIPYHFYDINGIVKYQNLYNESFDDEDILRAIIFNNHVYPTIGGKKPRRVPKPKKIKIKFIENGMETLKYHVITCGKIPGFIKMGQISSSRKLTNNVDNDQINVISFMIDNTKYINNPEYESCLKILKDMGIEDQIKDNIRITDIPTILIKLYVGEKAVSFFPEKNLFTMKAVTYNKIYGPNEDPFDDVENENICHIDKNKAHSWSLYSLPYLICFDYRYDRIIKNPFIKNPLEGTIDLCNDITDHNLYLCIPKYFTLDMPETGIYAGYDVKRYLKLNIKFDIVEEFECRRVSNYYRPIIDKIIKHVPDYKPILNILVGKFEKNFGLKYSYKFEGIFNQLSSKMHSGFIKEFGEYNLFYKCEEKYVGVRDNFPIAVQVKSWCRNTTCDKIRELGLKDDDIIRVNTDSIMYRGKLPKKLDPLDFNGWKEIPIKRNQLCNYSIPTNDRAILRYSNLKLNINSSRVLYNQYAGGGKTTFIVKEIVPALIKQGKSYIVNTPSHQTLQAYKKLGINCQIIHHYVYVDKGVPKEDYVIFDEVGFYDGPCNDVVYKVAQSGKDMASLGDYKQLKGVDGNSYDQEHYLNYLYNKIDTSFTNYRNNFTVEYYDSLINGAMEYLIKEVNAWSTHLKKAELIVCYKKETRDKYNKIMLQLLELEPYSEGTKLIAMSNNLHKFGIYNHKCLNVIETSDKLITLEDNDDPEKKYVLPRKQVNNPNYFIHRYAMNIHQVQGDTLKSYHWCSEDDWSLDGRMAYTIISRLKQKKGKKYTPPRNRL